MYHDEEDSEYVGIFFLDILREETKKITDAIIDGYITEEEGAENLKGFLYNVRIPTITELTNEISDTFIDLINSLCHGYNKVIRTAKDSNDDIDKVGKIMAFRVIDSLEKTCISYLKSQSDIDIKLIINQVNRCVMADENNKDDVITNILKEYFFRITKSKLIVTDTIMDFTKTIHDNDNMKDNLKDIFDDFDKDMNSIKVYDDLFQAAVLEYDYDDKNFYDEYIVSENSDTIYNLTNNINVKPMRKFNTYTKKNLF